MSKARSYFEVDKAGLAQIVRRRHPGFVFAELIANAFDQPGTTQVEVEHAPVPGRSLVNVRVVDNDPTGFEDLRDAYTLFRHTRKRQNAEVRGRFNLGEKEFLSLCQEATITTTIGQVRFSNDRRTVNSRRKTEQGSEIQALVKMTRADYEAACEFLGMIIPPEGVVLLNNGVSVYGPDDKSTESDCRLVGDFCVTLPTEIEDEDGDLRKTRRKTRVAVSTVPSGRDTAWLFEMGIPVCEIPEDEWDINIFQKVPLSRDRDSVTPAYLRTLRVAVVNNCFGELDEAAAGNPWVTEAIADEDVEQDAFESVVHRRYGDNAVVYDPSDKESNTRAVSEGRQVIFGGTLPKGAHENVRRFGTYQPAGKVTPSNRVTFSAHGKDCEVKNYTPSMKSLCEYVAWLGRHLLDTPVDVRVISIPDRVTACYGDHSLNFNLRRLGHRWFDTWRDNLIRVHALVIHELAHDAEEDHLSDDYHKACCHLGAKLAALLVRDVETRKQFCGV